MRFKLSPETINQGRDTQIEISQSSKRQAADAGEKIADFAEAVKSGQMKGREWNQRFSMSNEGAAFNMAKMNGGQMPGTESGAEQ